MTKPKSRRPRAHTLSTRQSSTRGAAGHGRAAGQRMGWRWPMIGAVVLGIVALGSYLAWSRAAAQPATAA
ncbi:MAG: hypothetical protein M3R61_12140 [Chloroflexota bacterium]|nr:hypothetical protein [Chloroflexota bacterium]